MGMRVFTQSLKLRDFVNDMFVIFLLKYFKMYEVSYPYQREQLIRKDAVSARIGHVIGGTIGTVGNHVGGTANTIGGAIGGVAGGIGQAAECAVNPRICIERKIRAFLSTYGPFIALIVFCIGFTKLKK